MKFVTDDGSILDPSTLEKALPGTEKSLVKADLIPGGKAAGRKPTEFDPKQIEMGIKVEMEHTGDKDKAREIAMDHLTEFPDYYSRLGRMEAKAKKALGKSGGEAEKEEEEGGREPNEGDMAAIKQFITENGDLDDAKFHAFNEKRGVNVHEAEEHVYELLHEKLEDEADKSLNPQGADLGGEQLCKGCGKMHKARGAYCAKCMSAKPGLMKGEHPLGPMMRAGIDMPSTAQVARGLTELEGFLSKAVTPVGGKTPAGYTVKMVGGKRQYIKEGEKPSGADAPSKGWVHNEQTYSDPSAAHEFAMGLKASGHAASIRIEPSGGKHVVKWMARGEPAPKRPAKSSPEEIQARNLEAFAAQDEHNKRYQEHVDSMDAMVDELEKLKHPNVANMRGFMVRVPGSKFYREPPKRPGSPAERPPSPQDRELAFYDMEAQIGVYQRKQEKIELSHKLMAQQAKLYSKYFQEAVNAPRDDKAAQRDAYQKAAVHARNAAMAAAGAADAAAVKHWSSQAESAEMMVKMYGGAAPKSALEPGKSEPKDLAEKHNRLANAGKKKPRAKGSKEEKAGQLALFRSLLAAGDLEGYLAKAAELEGEPLEKFLGSVSRIGSKGGKIIGTTASGKPIYQSHNLAEKPGGFSGWKPDDHAQAAAAHAHYAHHATQAGQKEAAERHRSAAQAHGSAASFKGGKNREAWSAPKAHAAKDFEPWQHRAAAAQYQKRAQEHRGTYESSLTEQQKAGKKPEVGKWSKHYRAWDESRGHAEQHERHAQRKEGKGAQVPPERGVIKRWKDWSKSLDHSGQGAAQEDTPMVATLEEFLAKAMEQEDENEGKGGEQEDEGKGGEQEDEDEQNGRQAAKNGEDEDEDGKPRMKKSDMPTGGPKQQLGSRGPADGLDLSGKPAGQGSSKVAGSEAGAPGVKTDKLSEDDVDPDKFPGKDKPLGKALTQEHLAAIRRSRALRPPADVRPELARPVRQVNGITMEKAHTFTLAQGAVVVSNQQDLECEALMKSQAGPWRGEPLGLDPTAAPIHRGRVCSCGEVYKSYLTACPNCGAGAVVNRVLPVEIGGPILEKSDSSVPLLRPRREPADLDLTAILKK